jgi:predicted DNA-binding transcriptional regulator YafY
MKPGQIRSWLTKEITAMTSPAGRLLTLLSMLQSRPRWTAAELADGLGVTERTVRRDISRLRDLGYPVDADAGRTGGYELGRGGRLPPLLLTDDEAAAVAVGLRVLAGGGHEGIDEAAVAALAKVEQVLPATLRARVAALHDSTVVMGAPRGPRVRPDVLLLLAQGCRGLERIRFRYEDSGGKVSERRVEPYRLVNVRRRWYLVAHDLDRGAWRTFRVDRVTDAYLTGHRFRRTSEPDAAELVAEGLSVGAYSLRAEVLLLTDLATAAEVVPRTIANLAAAPDGTLMRMGASDVEWMAHYLAGLPFEFEVRHPPELVDALAELGRRLQHVGGR